MLKVILVDDHQMVRKCLKSLLDNKAPEMQVVAEVASAPELFSVLPDTKADIVLMDINLPGMDGLAATSYLKEHFPEVKVIILSMQDQEVYITQALAMGALGYLTKTASQQELLQAIKTVGDNQKYLLNGLAAESFEKSLPVPVPSPSARPDTLSERELTVLRLIAEGYTNEEIADKLFNSKRTIETHRQNILVKTKSKNTASLIVYAARHHLLD